MNGKWPVLALVAAAAAAGAGAWYTQVYGFYERLSPQEAAADITAIRSDGTVTALPVAEAQGIDAGSSPLRWRACFTLAEPVDPATLTPFPEATPLIGPGWFDCYDAGTATDALASGAAVAVLSAPEVRPNVDRVLAIWPDGHGVGWHQWNDKNPARGVMD